MTEDRDEDTTEHDHALGAPADHTPPPAPFAGTAPAGVVWPSAVVPATVPDQSYPELFPPVVPLPLFVIMPERAKQRRWTVLLRAILAIPLEVVVIAVGIAAVVSVVLGWFAALVTGRAPSSCARW